MRAAVLLGALTALIGLVKYGLQMWPAWVNLYQAALHWTNPTQATLLAPPQDYILSSSAEALVLGAAHLTWQPLYVGIQVGLAIFAIVLPFMMLASRRSMDSARVLFLMMAGGPVVALLLTWVGGYDALCVIAATIAVLSKNKYVSVAAWLVLGIVNASVAVLGFCLWAVFLLLGLSKEQRGSTWRILFAAFSVAVGILAMWTVTLSWGGVTSRYEAYRLYGLDYYWNAFVAGMPLMLFSALGVGWIVLLDANVRRTRAARVVLFGVLIAALVIPFLALDETRIIAWVTIPTVLAWVATASHTLTPEALGRLWSRYAIAAAIVPVLMLTSGSIGPIGLQLLFHWRASF